MKVKEYEWGREGDVANESENGKGVGTWADHEHSEDEGKEKESRNTTPLLGLKTTRLHS